MCSTHLGFAQISDAEKNNLPRQRVQVEVTSNKLKLVPDLISAPNFTVMKDLNLSNRIEKATGTFRAQNSQRAEFVSAQNRLQLGMAIPKGQSLKYLDGKKVTLNWIDRERQLNQTHEKLRLADTKGETVLFYTHQVIDKPHQIKMAKGVELIQQQKNPQGGVQLSDLVLKLNNKTQKIALKKWQQFRLDDKVYWIYLQHSVFYPPSELNGGCASSGYGLKAIVLAKAPTS